MSSYCTIKTNKSKRVACRHQQLMLHHQALTIVIIVISQSGHRAAWINHSSTLSFLLDVYLIGSQVHHPVDLPLKTRHSLKTGKRIFSHTFSCALMSFKILDQLTIMIFICELFACFHITSINPLQKP